MIEKRALYEIYQSMGTFHLLAIVADEEGYTADAREVAKTIVWERLALGSRFSIKSALEAEVQRVVELAQRCHLCSGADAPYERTQFRLRKPLGVQRRVQWGATIGESLIGLMFLPILGVGRMSLHTEKVEHYQDAEVTFQRCVKCSQGKFYIEDVYTKHPYYEFYSLMGFGDLGS